MADRVRFERTSTKLTVLRITIILPISLKWRPRRGSNSHYPVMHISLRRRSHYEVTKIYNYLILYYSIVNSFKNIAHCLHSVKRLKTRSLGRTVCFFADQVAQLSNVPDYFQYLKLRLSDDCPHCCKIIKRTKMVA